ncbi:MAG: DNA primase [Pirellulales bacterium]
MSFTIDADTKERVRAATDIVDLIGSYFELRRQGRGFVGLCPWHQDRRPSLQVNPDRQIWKCWVCDIGGDAFNFIMQQERLSFPEAVKMLADRAGIVIESTPSPFAPKQAGDDKKVLLRLMEWAAGQYRHFLTKSGEADKAREYLADRGMTPESLQAFEIGMAPESWGFLADKAVSAGFNSRQLEAVGLCAKSERGSYYDRFRGRIMFPIRDSQKNLIAFGGRILPGATDAAKYINSPETRLFTKNQQLYGLDKARESIFKRKQAIVMEGYTDVIVAHQCGLSSAVAVLGTALGANHLKLLRRHACESVVLVLDGDEAGQRRSDEVLELFLNAQLDVRVMTLPDGLDPADFLLQYNADAFLDLVSKAPDALEFKMRRVCDGFDPLVDTHRANAAVETMLGLLAKVPRAGLLTDEAFRLRQNQILARLSRQFGLQESDLRGRLGSLRDTAPKPKLRSADTEHGDDANRPAPERLLRPGDLSPVERELMELVICSPHMAPMVLERVLPDWIQSSAARAMLDAYEELEFNGHPLDFDSVLSVLEDASLKSLLVTLSEQAQAKEQYIKDTPENRLRVLTERMGKQQEDMRLRRQMNTLADGGLSDQDELDLLNDMIRQVRQSHGLDNIEVP